VVVDSLAALLSKLVHQRLQRTLCQAAEQTVGTLKQEHAGTATNNTVLRYNTIWSTGASVDLSMLACVVLKAITSVLTMEEASIM
jgi:hypothetical protein